MLITVKKSPGSYSQLTPFSKSSSDLVMTTTASSLTDTTYSFNYQEEEYTNTERETGGERSPFSNAENITHRGGDRRLDGRNFTYAELHAATEGFCYKNFLSEGGFGSVYRGELGSCSEGSHRLLVYEYVCNGSLDQHLSKHSRRPLSWEKRMNSFGSCKRLKISA
ncbi:hypothetical protein GH714_017930 [Hevea brasiliensis]|uniref:non-specific serine/threonine protein kinase n=1 Tax=Hevea brasiliensis TaxID=3981 RepID=A0A6A6LKP7_HEVBR|nr:hypothetical protein GH714_017930 [Hevea brasiliensis]